MTDLDDVVRELRRIRAELEKMNDRLSWIELNTGS